MINMQTQLHRSLKELDSNHHLKTFVGAFDQLRSSGELLDATLACDDDQFVEAHRLVLSACSPVFRKLFRKTNHAHPLIYLKGVHHQDLLAIVDYIYKGEASVDPLYLKRFLKTAKDLEIQGLIEYELTDDKEDIDIGNLLRLSLTVENNNLSETLSECIKEDEKEVRVETVEQKFFLSREERKRGKYEIVSPFLLEDPNVIKWHLEVAKLISKIHDPTQKRPTIWKCNRCENTSTSKTKVETHAESHIKKLGLFSYFCNICGTTAPKTMRSLKRHMKINHQVSRGPKLQ